MTTKTELSTAYRAARAYINAAAGSYASYITDDMVMNVTKTVLAAAEAVRRKNEPKKEPLKK